MDKLKTLVQKKFEGVYVNTTEVVELDLYDLIAVEIHDETFNKIDELAAFVADLGCKLVISNKPNRETQIYIQFSETNARLSSYATTCCDLQLMLIGSLAAHLTCVALASYALFGRIQF